MKAIMMAVAVALSLSSVACGSPVKKCEKRCDNAAECDGVTDEIVDACKDGCTASEKLAEEKDCKKEFKKLQNCGGTKVDCEADANDDSCSSESDAFGDCVSE